MHSWKKICIICTRNKSWIYVEATSLWWSLKTLSFNYSKTPRPFSSKYICYNITVTNVCISCCVTLLKSFYIMQFFLEIFREFKGYHSWGVPYRSCSWLMECIKLLWQLYLIFVYHQLIRTFSLTVLSFL